MRFLLAAVLLPSVAFAEDNASTAVPTPAPTAVPTPAPTPFTADLAASRGFGFYLNNGRAWGAGTGKYGCLGLGLENSKVNFTEIVMDGVEFKQIAAGAFHSLHLMENGDVYGTGRNNKGQLGLGDGNTNPKLEL